ncbi:protein RRNAD1 [Osmerus eperlanus]|uniref:protein RRNAD1 n=1 Tax=Osmerus eperlanus TaxID=29151 RepID=UPI002E14C966
MSSPTLSTIQTRELSRNLITFLSLYKHISDSYIIEFFSEELWETLPTNWQKALCDLSPPQISDLLLDRSNVHRSYPSVWPLSLMAFRATAHTLAFPRMPRSKTTKVGSLKPEEFQENQCQSSLLGHIFRKHVKPKKQHEIRRLGTLVKQICDVTGCMRVVDVGSGQGHLSRFLSFGLGISVTGIEADATLVAMASKFDGQLLCTLEKEKKKNGSLQHYVPGPSPRHVTGWVNPKESWEVFIKQLGFGDCIAEDHIAAALKKSQWESMFVPEQKHLHGDQPVSAAYSDSDQTALSLEENDDMMLNTSYAIHNTMSKNAQESECQSMSSSSPKRFCKMEAGKELCADSYPYAHPMYEEVLPAAAVVCPGENEPGHPDFVLTGLHSCGDLSATLLRHFANCPHVRGITSVACCYMKITTKEKPTPPGLISPPLSSTLTNEVTHCEFGYPMSSWLQGLPGHQLSYKSREGACHAMEDYMQRLREESSLLKTHCYRAVLESVIRGTRPELRRAGIQTIKKSHQLPFHEYARLGLARVGLPADLPLDTVKVEAMLKQQGRVVVYFSLALLLAPVVETLVLLDRMIFLQEQGIESQLVPLFDPVFSPRNLVLVALKPKRDKGKTKDLPNPGHF